MCCGDWAVLVAVVTFESTSTGDVCEREDKPFFLVLVLLGEELAL